jgi:hypothetical protein
MMEKYMKNYPKYLAVAFTVIVLSMAIGFSVYQEKVAGARTAGITVQKCQVATTSPTYKIAGAASSTCEFDIPNAKGMDLGIMFYSSTTPPTLQFTVEVTNDELGANTNWYNYTYSSTTGDVKTWSGVPIVNKLAYSSSTDWHLIPFENLRGNRMKIQYSLTGAAGSVYMEAARDND